MEKIQIRLPYQHVTGKIWVVHGFAKHMKTGVPIVLISSLDDGRVEFIEEANFFDINPANNKVRFELVKPS